MVQKSFEINLPCEVSELLSSLRGLGLYATLVGGAVRDYLISGELSFDLDFELRTDSKISPAEIEKKLSSLNLNIEKLNFNVFSLNVGDYAIELALARQEVFQSAKGGHSDFFANFDGTLPYEKSFARRDLTINAIGIELKDSPTLIDPFLGVKDLEQKIVRPINENFYLDPVRMLRSLRFKQLLGFKYAETIHFEKFDLSKLSSFYFFKESLKENLNFGEFLNELIKLVNEFNVDAPKFFPELQLLAKATYNGPYQEKLAVYKDFLTISPTKEDKLKVIEFLQIKKKTALKM